MPKGLSYEEAASIPLVGLTAYQAINEVIQAQPGDKVLIQAGSGGVGSFAIQYAKAKGLYVATTGSDSGKELIESLNPDEFINYKNKTSQRYSKTSTVYLIRLEERTSRNRSKFLSHMASSRPFQDCQLNVTKIR